LARRARQANEAAKWLLDTHRRRRCEQWAPRCQTDEVAAMGHLHAPFFDVLV
jgi:hypothetical protein